MTSTPLPPKINEDLIRRIKQKRTKNTYKPVFTDTVVMEILELRETYELSLREVSIYIKEVHGLDPSKSYIAKINMIAEKRALKQDILEHTPREGVDYPISFKSPTKTPKKRTAPPAPATIEKVQKRVVDEKPEKAQKRVVENTDNTAESEDPPATEKTQDVVKAELPIELTKEPILETKVPETPAYEKLEQSSAPKEDNPVQIPKVVKKKIKVKPKRPVTNNDNQTKKSTSAIPATKKKVETEVLEADIIGRPEDETAEIREKKRRAKMAKDYKRQLFLQKRQDELGEDLPMSELRELWALMKLDFSGKK